MGATENTIVQFSLSNRDMKVLEVQLDDSWIPVWPSNFPLASQLNRACILVLMELDPQINRKLILLSRKKVINEAYSEFYFHQTLILFSQTFTYLPDRFSELF